MSKNKFLIILIFSLLLFSCKNKADDSQAPELLIKQGKNQIEYYTYNGTETLRDNIGKLFVENFPKNIDEIIHIKNNADIKFEFTDKVPREMKLSEYILNTSGGLKYSSPTDRILNLNTKNNKADFKIESNLADYLSSNSNDYGEGKSIRGYQLECEFYDSLSESSYYKTYYFILRTDTSSF